MTRITFIRLALSVVLIVGGGMALAPAISTAAAAAAAAPIDKKALIEERVQLESDIAEYDADIDLAVQQAMECQKNAAEFQANGNNTLAAACRGMAAGFRQKAAELRGKRDLARLRIKEIERLLAM